MVVAAWFGWLVSAVAQLLIALGRFVVELPRDSRAARTKLAQRVRDALRQDVV